MHFSRPFNTDLTNGDILDMAPLTTDPLRKTSFEKIKVLQFLARNGAADRIVVNIVDHPFGVKSYALIAKVGTIMLEQLIGDFPCPNQCIPPGTEINSTDFTFDAEHVFQAMNFQGCIMLNVHGSTRLNSQGIRVKTHSIYGIDNMTDMDPIPSLNSFTSVTNN